MRSFCNICGSTLFCESSNHPDKIDIALANIEDDIAMKPDFHIHFGSRAKWLHIDDDLVKIEEGSA